MKFFKSLTLAVALMAGMPAAAQQVTVDQSFFLESINWRGSTGRFIIMWRPIEIDGKIAVCGAYSSRGGIDDVTDRAVEALDFYRDDRRVLRDLSFFREISSRHFDDALLGQPASCRVTRDSVTGAEASQYSVRFSKTRF